VAEPLLVLRDVSKSIGGNQIVQPLSLTLPAGQVLALCGGNGAGKSTILRMVIGNMMPSSGAISLDGLEWRRSRREYAAKIGYMPDDFNFGMALTARETVCFYAALRDLGRSRAEEVLEVVGLTEAADRKVASFSKGMRQRLLFAQALLARPRLLVLDEPTNGLDPRWMRTFAELAGELKKNGQSMLLSTHNLPVAEEIADRVVLLDAGRVVSTGSVDDYRQAYGNGGLARAFAEQLDPAGGTGASDAAKQREPAGHGTT
jgi:ABC-type multidrug transport system ATPase subunit